MNPVNTGVNDPSSNPKPLSQRAKESGASTADRIKGAAHHGAENAKARLSGQVESTANAQKARVADRIESVAGAVERVARELQENEPWLGKQAATAAERARRASAQLRERQLEDLAAEVRSWSSHPPLFLGGAFVLGLAMGRFIKGSRHQSQAPQRGSSELAKPQPPLPGIGNRTAPGDGGEGMPAVGGEPGPAPRRESNTTGGLIEEERR